MALYAGETVRIRCVATNVAGVALTSADVTLAKVVVFDAGGVEVVQGNLTWNSSAGYWYYDWTAQAGSFKVKAIFQGVDFQSLEYGRLRVKADPLSAA